MPVTKTTIKKFGRERDQRRALLRGLAVSLIEYERIETTLPKAKAIVPFVEKLITLAKRGDLHSRRLVIARLNSVDAGHRLVDEIAPKLNGRDSGHLRVERTVRRRGDNTQMAEVSFVDSLEDKPAAKSVKKAEPASTKKSSDKEDKKSKKDEA